MILINDKIDQKYFYRSCITITDDIYPNYIFKLKTVLRTPMRHRTDLLCHPKIHFFIHETIRLSVLIGNFIQAFQLENRYFDLLFGELIDDDIVFSIIILE